MLGKLFKKKQATENIGDQSSNLLEEVAAHLPKDAYITFTNLEQDLSRRISPKLTIGSEVGDLIIDDPTIAPRHCTFLISGDIVSVIDHSSEEGTVVNKKKLNPGKMFILNPGDKLKLGQLTALIEMKPVPGESSLEDEGEIEDGTLDMEMPSSLDDGEEQEGMSEMPMPNPEDADFTELSDLDIEMPEEEAPDETAELNLNALEDSETSEIKPEKTQLGKMKDREKQREMSAMTSKGLLLHGQEKKKSGPDYYIPDSDEVDLGDESDSSEGKRGFLSRLAFWKRKKKLPKTPKAGGKKKKIAKPKIVHPPATSAIIRVMAFLLDFLLAMSFQTMASPIEQFSGLFVSLPETLKNLFVPAFEEYLEPFYLQAVEQVPQIDEFIKAIIEFEFINQFVSFFFLTIAMRMVWVLILGVTLGQYLLGIRVKKGSLIIKRLKGLFREFFGVLTLPISILDIFSVFGWRTLKEILSFSRLTTPYPTGTNITIFIWIPLATVIYFCSPIFKNFELKESIIVDERGERRLEPWFFDQPVKSRYLGIKFDQLEKVIVLPLIEISVIEGKKYRKYGLAFFDLEAGESLKISKERASIKLPGMLRDFVDANPLSEYFQPNIHQFVKSNELNNKNFKPKLEDSTTLSIGVEVRTLISDIYQLNLLTLPNFVVDQGIVMRSHINFREKFETIFPYQIETITFTNFGNVQGLLFAHKAGKDVVYSYINQATLNPDLLLFSKDVSNIRHAKIFRYLKYPKKDETFLRADPASAYIDSLSEKKPLSEQLKVEKIIAERFKAIAKNYLENEKDPSEVQGLLNRNINSLEIDKKKDTKFYKSLVNTLNALTKKKYSYFGLERPLPKDENPVPKDSKPAQAEKKK